MTRRINVSSVEKDVSGLTPVGNPNTQTTWPTEVKTKPEDIRFTKRQADLAAQVAKTWQGNIESWSDFTQHTTFHGIKYIFDNDNPHKWRRYVWLVCVVAAISVFLMNFGQTMTNYFAFKTNVAVQIIYNDTCVLPAITVCNQNNFRISATNDEKLFTFIDEFYGTDDISKLDMSKYDELEEVEDSEGFIKNAAHQAEDFIDKCTWRGKPCNMASDFEMTPTDLGICYTFNSGNDGNVKAVMDSGSSVALSLILNVEQYEYMRGPQNDAGIKILLHDQGEFPGARDLGFAAAPGTHTLVGIHRTQVKDLPPPHGKCQKDAEPVSNCKLKCKTKKVYERCGCRDIYMPNITLNEEEISLPVCNSTYLFFCVNKALEDIRSEHLNCGCPVPCQRVSYEPSLSYAQLSDFNVDRLVLTNLTRRQIVEKQFRLAKELTQRLDGPIIESDKRFIENIQGELSNLKELVEEFREEQTIESFKEKFDEACSAIEHDADLLFGWINDIIVPFALLPRQINEMKKSYSTTKDALYPEKDSDISVYFDQCRLNLTFPGNLDRYRIPAAPGGSRKKRSVSVLNWQTSDSIVEGLQDFMEADDDEGPGSEEGAMLKNEAGPGDGESCDQYMENTFTDMLQYPIDFNEKLETLTFMNETYSASVALIFPNIETNTEALRLHEICLDHITSVQEELIPIFTLTYEKFTTWAAITTVNELIPKTEALAEYIHDVLHDQVFNFQDMYGACFWIDRILNVNDLDYISSAFRSTATDMMKAQSRASTLVASGVTVHTLLNNSILPTFNVLQDYADANATKMIMGTVLVGDMLDMAMTELRDSVNDFSSAAKAVIQQTSDIGSSQHQVMSHLANYDVSIIPDVGYATLQQPREVLKYDPHFVPTGTSLEKKVALSIQHLFQIMLLDVTKTADSLGDTYECLKTIVRNYKDVLESYLSDVHMNSKFYMDNFLQVDVFYKELKYELIQTNEAFSRGSMFGEIGGFLGLLLGASILTVCELVDHAILTTLNWWRKKKGRRPPQKNNTKMMY